MNVSRHELHLLTGAYACDTLPPAELAAFERHLRRCPACAEEVRGLRETTAKLGLATAVVPPSAMRARVLAAAAETRQEAPPARRTADGPRRARRLPRVALRRPVLSGALTALAAAVITLGVFSGLTHSQLQRANARDAAITAVIAAPDARLTTARTSIGGTVTAVVALREHQAVITAHGMPSLSGARVYQLWVMAPGRVRSAGLLTADSTASVLAAGVLAGDRIGMTVEPAGGTSQPTTAPIMVMPAQA